MMAAGRQLARDRIRNAIDASLAGGSEGRDVPARQRGDHHMNDISGIANGARTPAC